MKTMISVGATIALILFGATAQAVDVDWSTNFEDAKKKAAERNIPILADFSGSDWCGWCMRLDGEVFSKQEFKDFAKDAVVLFVADFPKTKELPPDVSKQNKELAEKYGVRGFPTVLILDKSGKEIARTGYRPGGAVKYVDHIKEVLKQAEK